MNIEPTTTLAPTTNTDDTASSSWFCGMCKNKPTTATISADVSAEFQIIKAELQELKAAVLNGTVQTDIDLVLADGQKAANTLMLFVPQLIALLTNNPAVVTDFSAFMTTVEAVISKATAEFGIFNSMIIALINTTSTTTTTIAPNTVVNVPSVPTLTLKSHTVSRNTQTTLSKINSIITINCPQLTHHITTEVSSAAEFYHFMNTVENVTKNASSSFTTSSSISQFFGTLTNSINNI